MNNGDVSGGSRSLVVRGPGLSLTEPGTSLWTGASIQNTQGALKVEQQAVVLVLMRFTPNCLQLTSGS
eukprot:6019403-Pyramimonas_sp.AAC.1